MSVSVNSVYSAVKNLANKDQQGFITPSEFNSFAEIAQLSIYNRLFNDLKNARRIIKAGFNPARDKSLMKRVEEDLSTFARAITLNKDTASGTFLKSDIDHLNRIISMSTFGSIMLDQSSRRPIDICYDEDKIERILLSDLSKPTDSYPVALVSENIEVFPTTIHRIRVRYYKMPTSVNQDGTINDGQPRYATTEVNGNDTFSSVNSRDFELPSHYHDMLVAEIAQMAGVNMRDGDVIQHGVGQETTAKQEGSF